MRTNQNKETQRAGLGGSWTQSFHVQSEHIIMYILRELHQARIFEVFIEVSHPNIVDSITDHVFELHLYPSPPLPKDEEVRMIHMAWSFNLLITWLGLVAWPAPILFGINIKRPANSHLINIHYQNSPWITKVSLSLRKVQKLEILLKKPRTKTR